ncbi:peptidoglycan-binding domain-containing protein [Natronohydrobacter thiooxidans]|uniref:peptidoglycan-binding domain-containing protein n=1 Tax=Natronohydrobacter thiooxidans TaxID=87172 RepID=UPI000AFC2398|nr:peptidoglycan-binding domain-containing protein [Natronohydrobacter thiooxidans]
MLRRARFALAAIVLATSAQADTDTASRARIEPAAVALSAPEARACWARYSAASGQARGGVIEEVAFRVPCPEAMGRGFIKTLQRALMARGYHEGPVTGVADAQTRAAVQAFQRAGGFNSPILTLETAQRLGLVPIELTLN